MILNECSPSTLSAPHPLVVSVSHTPTRPPPPSSLHPPSSLFSSLLLVMARNSSSLLLLPLTGHCFLFLSRSGDLGPSCRWIHSKCVLALRRWTTLAPRPPSPHMSLGRTVSSMILPPRPLLMVMEGKANTSARSRASTGSRRGVLFASPSCCLSIMCVGTSCSVPFSLDTRMC